MPSDKLATISNHFADVEDPRRDEGKRYSLIAIIMMTLCAVICHADTWPEIEEYAQAKEEWFKQFLSLPHGIPSHHTFRRLFLLLNPEQFQQGFLSWIATIQEATNGDVVAIDGKALRRSFTKGGKKGAIHMVNA